MSASEYGGLLASMDAVRAGEVLRDHFGSLSKEAAERLTLLATGGDKKAAAKAWTEAAKKEAGWRSA